MQRTIKGFEAIEEFLCDSVVDNSVILRLKEDKLHQLQLLKSLEGLFNLLHTEPSSNLELNSYVRYLYVQQDDELSDGDMIRMAVGSFYLSIFGNSDYYILNARWENSPDTIEFTRAAKSKYVTSDYMLEFFNKISYIKSVADSAD